MKGIKAKIQMDRKASPVYVRTRPVPYGLRNAVDAAIDKLLETGTNEPVQNVEWVTLIVPVVKQDKSIRICGD